MSELKVIFGSGNLSQGFPSVRVELRDANRTLLVQDACSLASAQDLQGLYQRWQLFHYNYYSLRRWATRSNDAFNVEDYDDEGPDEISDINISNFSEYSESELAALGEQLIEALNEWLSAGPFSKLEKKVRSSLDASHPVQVIIETEDEQLRKLPWWRWEFFEDYRQAGVVVSAIKGKKLNTATLSEKPGIKLLGILGDDTDLDLLTDQEAIINLTDVTASFLEQPTVDELDAVLWTQQWDILFFAGHSSGKEQGYIQLSPTQKLTITELSEALEKAIDNGLRLAIFNSCDGLKLAADLAQLNLPAIIVMREPVPNAVAQKFLRFFLESFSKNTPLDIAVIEAQRRLIRLEQDFPGASLLPTLVQNPAEVLPRWQQFLSSKSVSSESPTPHLKQTPQSTHPGLTGIITQPWRSKTSSLPGEAKELSSLSKTTKLFREAQSPKKRSWSFSGHHLRLLFQVSTIVVILLLTGRAVGWLESSELRAYDTLMQQRYVFQKESPDHRILIVKATSEDIARQAVKPTTAASLSDGTLTHIFEALQRYEPVVIGLDIYRPIAATPALTPYLEQENVIGVCKAKAPGFGIYQGMAPAPEIEADRVGFADFVEDDDGILRRHLLSRKPDLSGCTAQDSLNFHLALYYLWKVHDLEIGYDDQENLILGQAILKEIQANAGGYHRMDARGRQMMLNYRSLRSPLDIADSITVSELLDNQVSLENLKNRVVLIGTTKEIFDSNDYWKTPYSANQPSLSQEIPGVFIHAQMVSQLISAALDNRPLITVWPQGVESVWIWIWSLVGGGLAVGLTSPKTLGISVFSVMTILYGFCYILLVKGIWIPLIPAMVAFLLTAFGVVLVQFYRQRSVSGDR